MSASAIFSRCTRQPSLSRLISPNVLCRRLHGTPVCRNAAQKYLEKVQKRAEHQGISVDELKQKVREGVRPELLPEARQLQRQSKKLEDSRDDGQTKPMIKKERRDKSPVRPLAEIMDIHKVLRASHTAEQITALWTAFHASRSGGTGRGYLSASVPIETYEKLLKSGKKYPTFILPLLREASQAKSSESSSDEQTNETAYEFFFMQWAFHPALPIPTPSILDPPLPSDAIPSPPAHPVATILFTPLLEYKTRTTFAAPHLVLTMYPDLAQSHQLVLLRGELTPSPSGTGRYVLSQQDAQLLALGLQRFYLADVDEREKDAGRGQRTELLRVFNESPSEFRWEDLLKHASPL